MVSQPPKPGTGPQSVMTTTVRSTSPHIHIYIGRKRDCEHRAVPASPSLGLGGAELGRAEDPGEALSGCAHASDHPDIPPRRRRGSCSRSRWAFRPARTARTRPRPRTRGMPDSSTVGSCGRVGARTSPAAAIMRTSPVLSCDSMAARLTSSKETSPRTSAMSAVPDPANGTWVISSLARCLRSSVPR